LIVNPLLEDLIRREVKGKLARQEPFTAYTVTLALRARNLRVDHQDVRRLVHGMFRNGELDDYGRELRDMGGPARAWYYQPEPTSSLARHRCPSTVARSYLAFPTSGNRRDRTPHRVGLHPRKVDRRGTVCIPAVLIRGAGLRRGDRAVVLADVNRGRLAIALHASHGAGPPPQSRSYTVDKYGNIRITRAAQRQAGVSAGSYRVERTADGIVIEPAAEE
jgi:bifunctional DNA-binding transcriptional regulator/antitoxin component of YhaV-PrlF toxin-antitoxin module